MRILLLFLVIVLSSETAIAQRVNVRGYFRKDGTYVGPHTRSLPNGYSHNNGQMNGIQHNFMNPYWAQRNYANQYWMAYFAARRARLSNHVTSAPRSSAHPQKPPIRSPAPTKTGMSQQDKASSRITLAKNLLRDGKKDFALHWLQKVTSESPNTIAAQEAVEIIRNQFGEDIVSRSIPSDFAFNKITSPVEVAPSSINLASNVNALMTTRTDEREAASMEFAASSNIISGTCTSIWNWYTITIKTETRSYVIRLAGVTPTVTNLAISEDATSSLSQWIQGKKVQVDIMEKDQNGTFVGLVSRDGVSINEKVVFEILSRDSSTIASNEHTKPAVDSSVEITEARISGPNTATQTITQVPQPKENDLSKTVPHNINGRPLPGWGRHIPPIIAAIAALFFLISHELILRFNSQLRKSNQE